MSNDNVLEEFAEVDRKLWEEGGGTIDGFFDLCHRIAQEDVARSGVEPARTTSAGAWTPEADAVPDHADAVCVREGDTPKYGETSGSPRDAGAEGE